MLWNLVKGMMVIQEQIYAGERKSIEDEVAVLKERRIRLNGLLKGYLHVGHMKKLMPLLRRIYLCLILQM